MTPPTTTDRRPLAVLALVVALGLALLPASPASGGLPSGTANNPLPERCDLDIAITIDRSNSIANDDPANPDRIRDAVNDFVADLASTPARVALFSYGTLASGYSGPNPQPSGGTWDGADFPAAGFQPTADPVARQTLADTLTDIPFASSASPVAEREKGWTNWQAGLGQGSNGYPGAAAADGATPADADLVIVFTDGNPTVHNAELAAGPPAAEAPTTADVAAAVSAADALKAGGSRVVAVAVGDVNADNLARITGGLGASVEGEDYFALDNFGQLAEAFEQVAVDTCGANLTIRKLTPDTDAQLGWGPEPDWTFNTAFPGGEPTALSQPAGDQQTAEDGTVVYSWVSAEEVPVTITETLEGMRLRGSDCTNEAGESLVFDETTISLPIASGTDITCTFNNYPPDAAIVVDKTPDPATMPEPGGTVIFTVTVTNPATYDPITIAALTDDIYGDLLDAANAQVTKNTCHELAGDTLAPGEQATCAFAAEVTGSDNGTATPEHRDVVTVTGEDPDGGSVTDDDDATVDLTPDDEAVVSTGSISRRSSDLPRTGGNVAGPAALATALIAAGGAGVYLARGRIRGLRREPLNT